MNDKRLCIEAKKKLDKDFNYVKNLEHLTATERDFLKRRYYALECKTFALRLGANKSLQDIQKSFHDTLFDMNKFLKENHIEKFHTNRYYDGITISYTKYRSDAELIRIHKRDMKLKEQNIIAQKKRRDKERKFRIAKAKARKAEAKAHKAINANISISSKRDAEKIIKCLKHTFSID